MRPDPAPRCLRRGLASNPAYPDPNLRAMASHRPRPESRGASTGPRNLPAATTTSTSGERARYVPRQHYDGRGGAGRGLGECFRVPARPRVCAEPGRAPRAGSLPSPAGAGGGETWTLGWRELGGPEMPAGRSVATPGGQETPASARAGRGANGRPGGAHRLPERGPGPGSGPRGNSHEVSWVTRQTVNGDGAARLVLGSFAGGTSSGDLEANSS